MLFRPPPEGASFNDMMALTGRQRLAVALRKRSVTAYLKTPQNCVGDAVALAGRQGVAQNCLSGAKVVSVHVRLDLTFKNVTAAGNYSRAFVTIIARNTKSDVVLSVVPPYINLAATSIVELDGDISTAARTSGIIRTRSLERKKAGTPTSTLASTSAEKVRTPGAGGCDDDSPVGSAAAGVFEDVDDRGPQRTRVSLKDHFIFQREFGGLAEFNVDVDDELEAESEDFSDEFNSGQEDEDGSSDLTRSSGRRSGDDTHFLVSTVSNVARLPSDSSALGGANQEDFDVFIPSFGRRSKQAVAIGPEEVFDFVFAITPKLSDGACTFPTDDNMPHLGSN